MPLWHSHGFVSDWHCSDTYIILGPKIIYQTKWNKAWQTVLDSPQAVPEVNTVAHIYRPENRRQ